MSRAFIHPSRPGFYGTTFPEDLRGALARVCDALVPGNVDYPSASVAQVPRFIEDRASEADRTRLEGIVEELTQDSGQSLTESLTQLQDADPVTFGWLRELVYHGYYASRRVIAAMTDRGYDYHGAPQPLGYRLPGTTTGPRTARGSYIPTDEVRAARA